MEASGQSGGGNSSGGGQAPEGESNSGGGRPTAAGGGNAQARDQAPGGGSNCGGEQPTAAGGGNQAWGQATGGTIQLTGTSSSTADLSKKSDDKPVTQLIACAKNCGARFEASIAPERFKTHDCMEYLKWKLEIYKEEVRRLRSGSSPRSHRFTEKQNEMLKAQVSVVTEVFPAVMPIDMIIYSCQLLDAMVPGHKLVEIAAEVEWAMELHYGSKWNYNVSTRGINPTCFNNLRVPLSYYAEFWVDDLRVSIWRDIHVPLRLTTMDS